MELAHVRVQVQPVLHFALAGGGVEQQSCSHS